MNAFTNSPKPLNSIVNVKVKEKQIGQQQQNLIRKSIVDIIIIKYRI